MADFRIYPLTFTPILRDYIWGGRRLETLYGRALPPGTTAESWEISGHPSAATIADTGAWVGYPLTTIFEALGALLVGRRGQWAVERRKFPLLVKLLDAQHDLSVQVHPGDAYALANEGGELGKAEMWYVLHADPGATLIHGLAEGVTREAFRAALAAGRLEAVLRRVPVAAGQAIDVPTGTVHALLAGTVVTEIQQNSDTTYRVYDWGRVGADGQPRSLHIAKALDVIAFDPAPRVVTPQVFTEVAGIQRSELVRNRYFAVEKIVLEPGAQYRGACEGATMELWGCVQGHALVTWTGAPVALPAIRYALLPAALGEFAVTAPQGATCLRAYLTAEA